MLAVQWNTHFLQDNQVKKGNRLKALKKISGHKLEDKCKFFFFLA